MSSRNTESRSDLKSVNSRSSIAVPPQPWYHISLRAVVLVLLPLFSLAGFYGTMVLADANGTFKGIVSLIDSKEPKFPDTNDDLLMRYTNVGWLDRQLTILVTFFAPVVDMNQGALSMFSIFGTGQFGAAWALMVMESMRAGNRWKVVSFIGTFGLFIQNISYTVTVPIWLFIHLLTSPVSKPFPGTQSTSVLHISSLDLGILPVSITLSYILPTFLMGLEYPHTVSTLTHQRLIALWQPFPLWTVLIHFHLKTTFQTLFPSTSTSTTNTGSSSRSQSSPGITYLNTANHVYRFILALCLVTHLPILVLSLLPPTFIPSTYPTLQTRSQQTPSAIYIPYFPSTSHKVSSLAEGVHTFLIWDVYVGSFAFLLWGILMYRNATTTDKTGVDSKKSQSWGSLLVKVGVWCGLAGPVGALAVLLWERDGIVTQKIKQGI
ncbi:hypothetical protein ONS95_008402 [Cadophora gregata]|uniref:uncharacterized protein n=1 Tax=Cadophora gregata TaxID=51156 RepID=UPI0026DC9E70|nr:uncharacterized protein ONS95_008402 [Cadophora gregata]KAK0126823.1 hypothetical protein ONS95_008402 [Cadophora gregata]